MITKVRSILVIAVVAAAIGGNSDEVAAFSTGEAFAASTTNYSTPCSIPAWNWRDPNNGNKLVSGGCTCYVAEQLAAKGVIVPPSYGSAESWWGRTAWPKGQVPRPGSIAAYIFKDGGHVGFVGGVDFKVNRSTQTEISGYKSELRFAQRGKWPPFTIVKVPTYRSYVTVTESYAVTTSNRDAYHAEKGVYTWKYTLVHTYRLDGSKVSQESWRGAPQGLMGFIYPPSR